MGQLPSAIEDPATAAAGPNTAILTGGLDAADASVAGIETWGPAGPHQLGSLPSALHDAAAASARGRVYFFGGGNGGTSSAKILRVDSGAPQPAGALPVPASDVAAVALGATFYVIGGYDGQHALNTIVAWQPGQRAHVVAHLPQSLRYAAVAATNGGILIAGGTTGARPLRSIYLFAPATRALRRLGSLPLPLTHAAAGMIGTTVYILGGRGDNQGTQRRAILAVDPASGHVSPAGHLPVALSDMGAASLQGRIVLFGGKDTTGRVHADITEVTAR